MARNDGKTKRRGRPFSRGFDPRRHLLTHEDRSRGGRTTARKYTCVGRWHLDWHDRCDRKQKGEY